MTTDLLRVLEELLVRAYEPSETAQARCDAADAWFRLVRAQKPAGVPHYTPHVDPELEEHERLHSPHMAQVTIRKWLDPRPIPPGELLPAWTGHPPAGWRPRSVG